MFTDDVNLFDEGILQNMIVKRVTSSVLDEVGFCHIPMSWVIVDKATKAVPVTYVWTTLKYDCMLYGGGNTNLYRDQLKS